MPRRLQACLKVFGELQRMHMIAFHDAFMRMIIETKNDNVYLTNFG